MENKFGDRRIEIHSGPDSLGRFRYCLFRWVNYFPGDPRGEYREGWKAQEFNAELPVDFKTKQEIL